MGGETQERAGLVATERLEALDHLRQAIDFASAADSYTRKPMAAMQQVADLVDCVAAEQGVRSSDDRCKSRSASAGP